MHIIQVFYYHLVGNSVESFTEINQRNCDCMGVLEIQIFMNELQQFMRQWLMEAPFSPYWQGSIYGATIGSNQSEKKDSNTLLAKAVLAIFLNSSTEAGGLTFGRGIWYSITQGPGYSNVVRMLL